MRLSPWPPKPALSKQVPWGALPSDDDYRLAHRLWSLPDANLAPNREAPQDDPSSWLVRNVYEHIISSGYMEPLAAEAISPNAQMTEVDGAFRGWSYDELFPDPDVPTAGPQSKQDILIDGHGWKPEKPRLWWNKQRLQEALRARNLSDAGKAPQLRERLFSYELRRQRRQRRSVRKLPRANLKHWGMERTNHYVLEIEDGGREATPLDLYTYAIILSPYNPTYWTSRAYLFYQLGHFDLALGDAYRAFFLVESLIDPTVRSQQAGLYPRIWDAIGQHLLATGPQYDEEPFLTMRRPNGINAFIPTLRRTFHHIISLSLLALEAWEDYEHMEQHLKLRTIQAGRHLEPFTERETFWKESIQRRKAEMAERDDLWDHEKRMGSIAVRRYPQAANDLNRTDDAFLSRLNSYFLTSDQDGSSLRVQRQGPHGLGVTAGKDLGEGVLLYAEEPSVRSQLEQVQRRRTSRCENCQRRLVIRRAFTPGQTCACFHTDVPVVFCLPEGVEPGESCAKIAHELYHDAACGRDWQWLHRAMQPIPTHARNEVPVVGEEGRLLANYEAHGTILGLLLRAALDMALIARRRGPSPDVWAHEIDAILPLCGGEDMPVTPEKRFPFGYAANIVVPFDILLNMGVDIFRDLHFDTWVIQMMLRKLLLNAVPWDTDRRGDRDDIDSAQGREDPIKGDIRPTFETLYVHTGFAMFNHACAESANACWFWDGDGEVENDVGIPNRIVVKTTRAIAEGEEIRVHYFPEKDPEPSKKLRLFGRDCDCASCNSSAQE